MAPTLNSPSMELIANDSQTIILAGVFLMANILFVIFCVFNMLNTMQRLNWKHDKLGITKTIVVKKAPIVEYYPPQKSYVEAIRLSTTPSGY